MNCQNQTNITIPMLCFHTYNINTKTRQECFKQEIYNTDKKDCTKEVSSLCKSIQNKTISTLTKITPWTYLARPLSTFSSMTKIEG